ncbi:MAG: type I 3-dehydroquinate dehydratase [Eubacterium sp.]|nr:type I 3-dehydroquinate dehydratase [Eubacterium sp.]
MLKKNTFAVCVPLTGENSEVLLGEIDAALAAKPDFLEWRRDYYTEEDAAQEQAVLARLAACEAGVIFTFRSAAEGGVRSCSDEERLAAIRRCVDAKAADYIDIELEGDPEFTAAVKALLSKEDCGLLLSHHNFERTYTMAEIVEILRRMEAAGADVLKLAMLPINKEDLRREITAVQNYSLASDKPIVMIAMGELGKITRIAPDILGGSLSYAVVKNSTAPGQLSIAEIRHARRALGVEA